MKIEIPQKLADEFQTAWEAPSNIALIKYWGKKNQQIPLNPSMSLTLDRLCTSTNFSLTKNGERQLDYLYDHRPHPLFLPKIELWWEIMITLIPDLNDYSLRLNSSNTFPHSAGIASSASFFATLGCALAEFLLGNKNHPNFLQTASFFARLGSGSAARSIAGPLSIWGESKQNISSSDEYAVFLNLHPDLLDLRDTIILIDESPKKMSSSLGHQYFSQHPYADFRIPQAHQRTNNLYNLIEGGDWEQVFELVEAEAYELHAMILLSAHLTLAKDLTWKTIDELKSFKKSLHRPSGFTLDAGPNIHWIHFASDQSKVESFLKERNLSFKTDSIGLGAKKIIHE